jgi:hypothetical protein
MKILNPTQTSLDELANNLRSKYPNLQIKKPFFTPRTIIVPYENFKMFIRDRKSFLFLDAMPPTLYSILGTLIAGILIFIVVYIISAGRVFAGGVLVIVGGLLIVKAIFKATNKGKFESFKSEIEQALVYNPQDESIF